MYITIDRDSEELVREVEKNVNHVWSTWRKAYAGKSSKDILAMTAYQFAKLYFSLQHSVESQEAMLKDFEGELDRLLQLTVDNDNA
jgi:23S rRNA U2552 (ribose-2'-O)-methylase RlmE/FtsJ